MDSREIVIHLLCAVECELPGVAAPTHRPQMRLRVRRDKIHRDVGAVFEQLRPQHFAGQIRPVDALRDKGAAAVSNQCDALPEFRRREPGGSDFAGQHECMAVAVPGSRGLQTWIVDHEIDGETVAAPGFENDLPGYFLGLVQRNLAIGRQSRN